jgi:hypothetical protein
MATAPVGTLYLASFWCMNSRVTCECIVRTCDLGLGMGIEFTGLDQHARLRLQHWLEGRNGEASQAAKARFIHCVIPNPCKSLLWAAAHSVVATQK